MNRPQRKHPRLPEYDYSQQGAYFLTICTKNRACILSHVLIPESEADGALVSLTEIGEIVLQHLLRIPGLDSYVIMPNHVHMLLRITGERAIRESPLRTGTDISKSLVGAVHERPVQGGVTSGTIPGESDDCHRRALREAPLQGARSLLSKAVGFLKMNSSKQIHALDPDLIVWQRSYYEHIVRNKHDYREIWKYIEGNPARWLEKHRLS